MDWVKSLQYFCVGLMAFFSLNAIAAQPEYVPGEVLIIPDNTFQPVSVQAQGMSVMNVYSGPSSFSKVKVSAGQTVEQAIQVLNNTPGVLHAEPNYVYHTTAAPNDPSFTNYWGLQNTGQLVNGAVGTVGADIRAVNAWDTATDCSAVLVAVIDSGVDYNHPDLAANIWNNATEIAGNGIDDDLNGFIDDVQGWDFVQADNTPMDENDHGTHVAGTIGAVGNNAVGGTGICWTASLMPVRVMDATGSGTTANIVAGVDYAVANGAKVINLSLGGTGFSSLFNTAIANANAAGVLVVAAAGNSGSNNDSWPTYPASYAQPNIIAVAATDQNGALASFSNYGSTSVDLAAPGVSIYSTIPPRQTVPGCSWNFDDGTTQGWTTSTFDRFNNIAVTDTMGVATPTANSGLYSLTDSVIGNYQNYRLYTATSPVCDLSTSSSARLEFAINMVTESCCDRVDFLSSTDGVTWTSVLGGVLSGSTGGWASSHNILPSANLSATTQFQWTLNTDVSVVADGVYVDDVVVTELGTTYTGSEYTYLQGTSMAAPHVAGVAALVLAANPGLTVSALSTRIIEGGDWDSALATKTASGKHLNANSALNFTTPTGLGAVNAGSQVDLTWTDNATTETSYEVWRNTGSVFINLTPGGLPANTTSYSDVTVIPTEQSYSYFVRVVTPAGTKASSTVVVASVISTPAAPTSLTVSLRTSGAYLTWNDNSFIETSYEVHRDGAAIAILSANAWSFNDTGISPDTIYTYEVFAVNASGASPGVSVTRPVNINAATLSGQALTGTTVGLVWTDNSSIETSYAVDLCEEISYYGYTYWSCTSNVATLPANSQSYNVSGLNPTTVYQFKVKTVVDVSTANGTATYSAFSNAITVTTPAQSSGGGGGGGGALGSFLLFLLLPWMLRFAPIARNRKS